MRVWPWGPVTGVCTIVAIWRFRLDFGRQEFYEALRKREAPGIGSGGRLPFFFFFLFFSFFFVFFLLLTLLISSVGIWCIFDVLMSCTTYSGRATAFYQQLGTVYFLQDFNSNVRGSLFYLGSSIVCFFGKIILFSSRRLAFLVMRILHYGDETLADQSL